MKREALANVVWTVVLSATDGRRCLWEFRARTLSWVKDIVRGYVESCPYDCDWAIMGCGKRILGKSRQKDCG